MNAMRQAHADGWFIVFDTLTLADDRLEAFYDNPNALRDYFRDIGRMVLAAGCLKVNDSHADCYQYFFFFSSRRRHTRLQGDWSSDVYSSDLKSDESSDADPARDSDTDIDAGIETRRRHGRLGNRRRRERDRVVRVDIRIDGVGDQVLAEIGRASCRERV